jgi:hypothetical protein
MKLFPIIPNMWCIGSYVARYGVCDLAGRLTVVIFHRRSRLHRRMRIVHAKRPPRQKLRSLVLVGKQEAIGLWSQDHANTPRRVRARSESGMAALYIDGSAAFDLHVHKTVLPNS